MTSEKAKNTHVAATATPAGPKPLRKPQAVHTDMVAIKNAAPAPKEVAVAAVSEIKVPKVNKEAKKPKLKVVRDSFTMPENEYCKISAIKEMCLNSGMQVKKSEVLRAGVIALTTMTESQLKAAIISLDKIKTGRPNKSK